MQSQLHNIILILNVCGGQPTCNSHQHSLLQFHNGGQLMSVYQQTVAALAVAEQVLFEHYPYHEFGN